MHKRTKFSPVKALPPEMTSRGSTVPYPCGPALKLLLRTCFAATLHFSFVISSGSPWNSGTNEICTNKLLKLQSIETL